jgi:hypothetical protein
VGNNAIQNSNCHPEQGGLPLVLFRNRHPEQGGLPLVRFQELSS